MKTILFIPIFLVVSCMASQNGKNIPNKDVSENSTIEIYVNYYLDLCDAEGRQLCLQIKEADDKEWKNIFGQIEGFEFEWGYTYKLEITKEKNKYPSIDGSNYQYQLVSILEKEQVSKDQSFTLELDESDINNADGEYVLLNTINIEFDSPGVQEALNEKFLQDNRLIATFKLGKDTQSITLVSIQ